MKTIIRKYIVPVVCSAMLIVTVSSCSKDKYYKDGGLANPKFNGTMLQYLQSKPVQFDSLAQVIKLAGMEDLFSKESVTFFAPTDEVIRRTIGQVYTKDPMLNSHPTLNQMLFALNKDTIKQLSDIPGSIWKKYLMRYLFKGTYYLKDYPQLDFALRPLYPGGYYQGYNGDLANIGVIFFTANTVKYSGYRQLCIASVTDPTNPQNYYYGAAAVASSDIQPTNGVVHSLAVYYPGADTNNPNTTGELRMAEDMEDYFGMSTEFLTEVILSK